MPISAEQSATFQKRCPRCSTHRPSSEFYRDPSTASGMAGWCKPCKRQYQKEWSKANPEKVRAASQRANERRRGNQFGGSYPSRYGITVEDYWRMHAQQDGKCLICGGTEDRLVVDHCHETSKVRGLLCNRCNVGIGYFRHDPDRLMAASAYLLAQVEVIRGY